jgi:hypothetical protein
MLEAVCGFFDEDYGFGEQSVAEAVAGRDSLPCFGDGAFGEGAVGSGGSGTFLRHRKKPFWPTG